MYGLLIKMFILSKTGLTHVQLYDIMSLGCNRGKPMETLGRKARNLTGKPHDSSAARNYLLCGLFYFEEKGRSAFGFTLTGVKKRKKGRR